MNSKTLTLLALAALCLCIAVPASAMWNNGNWLPDNANDGYQVHFDPQTGVTSKYKDINPVNEIKASNNGNGGWAEGFVRAGYSTLSDTIAVRNVLQADNVSPMSIEVNADGTFRIPAPGDGVLAPGDYTATLDNFNLPDETVYFTIAANQQGPTRISFIGQAVSSPASVRTLEIVKALYGETKEVCDQITEYQYLYWEGPWWNRHSHWSSWSTTVPEGYTEHGHHACEFHKRTSTQCHTEGKIIDVTGIVRGLVSNGHLTIIADYPNQHYNALFTDPAPGIFKHLSVDYKINGGATMHKVVAEDVDLNI